MALAAPPGTDAQAIRQRVAPNQSLYFQNLPEKLQKEDLRRELYMLLSTYGPVIDITALKTRKMVGQAHVLFKDIPSATQAMRGCQGFEFYGREMKISYSKNRSNTLAKLTGKFDEPSTAEQSSAIAQQPSSFVAPPGTEAAKAAPRSTLPPPPAGLPAPPAGLPKPPGGLPPPTGLPAKPTNGTLAPRQAASVVAQEAASPQGVKRGRDESDDEDAAMEEDDDDEGAMEMSDSD